MPRVTNVELFKKLLEMDTEAPSGVPPSLNGHYSHRYKTRERESDGAVLVYDGDRLLAIRLGDSLFVSVQYGWGLHDDLSALYNEMVPPSFVQRRAASRLSPDAAYTELQFQR